MGSAVSPHKADAGLLTAPASRFPSVSLSVIYALADDGGQTVCPGKRCLELGGQRQQRRLAKWPPHELDAQRQAVRAVVERQRDSWLAGDIPDRGEGRERHRLLKRSHRLGGAAVNDADAWRALA